MPHFRAPRHHEADRANAVNYAGWAVALVVAVWVAGGVVFALQAASCRLEAAWTGQKTQYRLPGGCYVLAPGYGWIPLPQAKD